MDSLFTAVAMVLVAVINGFVLYRIHQVERHTNSMKDALVAAASREGVARGKAQEKAAQISEAATASPERRL